MHCLSSRKVYSTSMERIRSQNLLKGIHKCHEYYSVDFSGSEDSFGHHSLHQPLWAEAGETLYYLEGAMGKIGINLPI